MRKLHTKRHPARRNPFSMGVGGFRLVAPDNWLLEPRNRSGQGTPPKENPATHRHVWRGFRTSRGCSYSFRVTRLRQLLKVCR